MALASTALVASGAAYLDAKYHISKDLATLYYAHRGDAHQATLKAQNRINIWATFTENCRDHAAQDCIWFSDPSTSPPTEVTYTWSQAYDRACQWAHWFLENGIEPGECVGLYLQNSPDFVLGWMGMLAVGCYPAMINYNLVGGALVHCVKVAECKLLLVDEDFVDRVFTNNDLEEMGVRCQTLDSHLRTILSSIPPRTPDPKYTGQANEKTKLALRYTSGTTGHPKGVMATTGKYYARLASQFTQMGIRPLQPAKSNSAVPSDRWYITIPMNHSTAGSAALICMLFPTTCCIGKRFSASRFWSECRSSRATVGTYVGEITRYLLANPPDARDRMHEVRMVYGNGLRPDVWERFQERFGVGRVCEFYGSTEGGLTHIVMQEGGFLRGVVGHDGLIRRMQLRNKVVPVLVDPGTNEIVRDEQTGFARRTPYDVGGEILFQLRSPAEFIGYWQNPEATNKKLARDVFKRGDLWYRSGDSLKRDNEGRWTFLDRLGDSYRWKGENVSTAEVSECLGRYDGVVDANVYGVEVPSHDGRAGCAALFMNSAAGDLNLEDLLRYVANSSGIETLLISLQACEEGFAILCCPDVPADCVDCGTELDWAEAG